MRWIEGLPIDQGATDCMDSARLAAMLATLGHPQAPDLRKYLYAKWGIVRCPVQLHSEDWCTNPWNVTRDQLVPVIIGLWRQQHYLEAQCLCKAIVERGYRAQNQEADRPGSHKPWWNGADIFFGAEKELVQNILYDRKGRWKLKLRILWHCFVQPYSEVNQLLCMAKFSGLLDMWKKFHPNWKLCLERYWLTGSRQDIEVYEFIVSKLAGI